MDHPYLQQVSHNINSLVSVGKVKEAYAAYKALIEKHPNVDLKSVKSLLDKKVVEHNNKIIDSKLLDMQVLFDSKDYAKAIVEMKSLLALSYDHKKLNSLYKKAQKLYEKKVNEDSKKMEVYRYEYFMKLLDESHDKFLSELFRLDKSINANKKTHEFTALFRKKLIDKLIDSKKDLIRSENVEALNSFLEKLKSIDSNSDKVKDLELKISRIKVSDTSQKQIEFLFNARSELDVLMRMKKFDKAMKLAEEIIALDPKSSRAKRAFNKAKKSLYYQTRNLTVDLIVSEKSDLKSEFKSNPKAFVYFL